MNTEGRVTRSMARTGQTPLCGALPDGRTPATRTTRRRAAAAKEADAVPTPRAALFDLTNVAEEDPTVAAKSELPTVEEAAPPAEAAPQQQVPAEQGDDIEEGEIVGELASAMAALGVAAPAAAEGSSQGALDAEDSAPGFSLEAPADEPPATPPPSALPASPAHLAPAPTPTGLGLSSLAPMSPLAPTAILGANTPAATPMQGVPSGQQAKVYDMLSAAAKVFEADEEPEEEALAAATAASPMMAPVAGFGSPVKFNESPAVSVSIGPAISAEASLRSGMRAMEEDGEVCSGSPAGMSVGMRSPASPALSFQPGPSPAATTTTKSRGESSPFDPATPLELDAQEEEEVAVEDPVEESHLERPVSSTQAVPLEMADPAPRPKLRSKVVVPSPSSYDPRSLRQLKKEIKQKLAEKGAASAANSEADEAEEEYEGEEQDGCYNDQASGELLQAMGALQLESPVGPFGLRGMPKPQGQHIRFDEDGQANVSPGLKVLLRGMPTPKGKHQFFGEDDE